ncbi:MAG: histidine phosphatase family protein [Actinomycetales bacterium]
MIERCDLQTLWLVRHGESVGNIADRRAREQHADRLDLDVRDPDVRLSDTGRDQARSVGEWLAREQERPDAVVTSPYRRATETADLAFEALVPAFGNLPRDRDERLRERDLGMFDGLTGLGIRDLHAEEAQRRARLGKFYYRPPGGESWCDVALRVRQVLTSLSNRYPGQRVLVVTHQAVIMLVRYVLEGFDESELLTLDRTEPLSNCGVTRYDRDPEGSLRLTYANDTSALSRTRTPKTREPDSAAVSEVEGSGVERSEVEGSEVEGSEEGSRAHA